MLTTRRQALKTLTAVAIASTAASRIPTFAQAPAAAPAPAPATEGPFKLPPLPYAYDALEPTIDKLTMQLHHDKHHAAYVKNLNIALAKEPSFNPGTNVEDLMKNLNAVPESIRTAVRNNGGGHANHSLLWETISPKGGTMKPEFSKAIEDDLGGMEKFTAGMYEQGGKVFGSGWVWLVLDGGKKLTIMTLPNQDSPLSEGHYPLFGIDVWEHAYYLKHHNVRADYIGGLWAVCELDVHLGPLFGRDEGVIFGGTISRSFADAQERVSPSHSSPPTSRRACRVFACLRFNSTNCFLMPRGLGAFWRRLSSREAFLSAAWRSRWRWSCSARSFHAASRLEAWLRCSCIFSRMFARRITQLHTGRDLCSRSGRHARPSE